MTSLAREPCRRRVRRGGMLGLFALFVAGIASVAIALFAYLLQPRWTGPVAPDGPALPITIAGVGFTVPPAAIRIAVQRRAGPQERIDLAYRWPELTPPDTHAAASMPRLFVTIESA